MLSFVVLAMGAGVAVSARSSGSASATVYVGDAVHKGTSYPGDHQAIYRLSGEYG
jgi:hypothetical protein